MEVLLIPIDSKFGDETSIQKTAKFLETRNTIPAENTLLLTSRLNRSWKTRVIKTTVGIKRDTKRAEWLKFISEGACNKTTSQIVDGIRKLIIEDTKKKIKRMIVYVGRREVISVILWAEKNNLYRSDVNRDNVKSGSVLSINITVQNEIKEVRRKRIVKEIFTP